jgi:hypothetical protein
MTTCVRSDVLTPHSLVTIEVEHAFNLTIVILLGAPEQVLPEAVKALTYSLSNTESTKTSLKQKM